MNKEIEIQKFYFHFNLDKFNVEFIRILEIAPFVYMNDIYEEGYLCIDTKGNININMEENIFYSMKDLCEYAHYMLERRLEDEYLSIAYNSEEEDYYKNNPTYI